MKLSTSMLSGFDPYEIEVARAALVLRRTDESSEATERRIDEKQLSKDADIVKLTRSAIGLNDGVWKLYRGGGLGGRSWLDWMRI